MPLHLAEIDPGTDRVVVVLIKNSLLPVVPVVVNGPTLVISRRDRRNRSVVGTFLKMDDIRPPGDLFKPPGIMKNGKWMTLKRDRFKRIITAALRRMLSAGRAITMINHPHLMTGLYQLLSQVGDAHRPRFEIVINIMGVNHHYLHRLAILICNRCKQ